MQKRLLLYSIVILRGFLPYSMEFLCGYSVVSSFKTVLPALDWPFEVLLVRRQPAWNDMIVIAISLYLLLVFLPSPSLSSYPVDSLQCYSSLTQPRHKVICPEARNTYCVKQVSTLTQNLCGATQYYGDIYTNSECQFKKCSDTCSAGSTTFTYQGNEYTRTTYCCKTDYCNSAPRRWGGLQTLSFTLTLAVSLLSFFLLYQ